MKQTKSNTFKGVVALGLIFIPQIYAGSCTPTSGVRIWDNVISTLTKVCTIESVVDDILAVDLSIDLF